MNFSLPLLLLAFNIAVAVVVFMVLVLVLALVICIGWLAGLLQSLAEAKLLLIYLLFLYENMYILLGG